MEESPCKSTNTKCSSSGFSKAFGTKALQDLGNETYVGMYYLRDIVLTVMLCDII